MNYVSMRKLIVFFSFLLLLLPIALAETKIFSGKVTTDTDKVIDGGTFKFRYDNVANKVFVQTPSTNMIIDNGACKSNSVFRVCINSANFTDRDPTTFVYYYELDVDIYKLTGSLATSISATSDTLLQSESSELKIVITNPTDFDISDIVFSYDLTPFFIQEVQGCSLDGKKLTWSGGLKSKYDKVCKATIIADKEGMHALTGSLNYFNGYETETKATNALSITVLPNQLKIDQLIGKDIEVNQRFFINTSMENLNKDEEIELIVTIEVPSNFKILKNIDINKYDNTLKLNTKLEPGSMKNYSIYLEAIAGGSNPIKQKFDYSIKNTMYVIENDTFINPLEPKPTIDFTLEYAELLPGQKFIVVAKLNNPSRVHTLTDIKATLNASYNGIIEQSLNRLMPNESYTIISSVLVTPENIDEIDNQLINLNLNVGYKFGEVTKSVNRYLELKVKQPTQNTTTSIDVQAPQTKTDEIFASKNDTGGATIRLGFFGLFGRKNDTAATTITRVSGFFTLKIAGLVLASLVVIITVIYIVISFGFREKVKKEPEQDKALEEIEQEIKHDEMNK